MTDQRPSRRRTAAYIAIVLVAMAVLVLVTGDLVRAIVLSAIMVIAVGVVILVQHLMGRR